jgi:hypothetical protein
MMKNFRDKYGLINSRSDEDNAENAILFTIQHYILTNEEYDVNIIHNALNNMRIAAGIMTQRPESHGISGHDHYMSHDNLTAIISFSYIQNSYYHKELWEEIKRQWFRYNNIDEIQGFYKKLLNPRFLHPRDILFYGTLCGGFLWKLLIPFTLFFMLISFNKRKGGVLKTDDDLLNFVKLSALRSQNWFWRQVWKFNMWKVRREFGSYHNVFRIYFKEEAHPNNVDSTHL